MSQFCVCFSYLRLACNGSKALTHEQYGPCGRGEPFEPHVVGPDRLKRTGCHLIHAETDG